MSVKDHEVPFYKIPLGAVVAITFDFDDVLPTDHYLDGYEITTSPTAVTSLASLSIMSLRSMILNFKADAVGETLVTVLGKAAYLVGTIDTKSPQREPLQIRIQVEA